MLRPRQDRFVQEYLIDLNATRAAIRAGYSAKTAEQGGQQLLRNIKVAAAIKEAQEKRAAKVEVTQEYVLQTIIDTIKLCQEEGVTKAGDILRGSELLGRHLAMFTDKAVVNHRYVAEVPEVIPSAEEWRKQNAPRLQ